MTWSADGRRPERSCRARATKEEPATEDAFHPVLTTTAGDVGAGPLRSRLHHVRSADVTDSTAQTTGMQRFAAISGAIRGIGEDLDR